MFFKMSAILMPFLSYFTNLSTYSMISLIISIIIAIIVFYLLYDSYITKDYRIDFKYLNWRDFEPSDPKNSELPSLYPNGWIPILESRDLKPNQIKPIFAFGKDLIVFRGSSGKCYVFDAYCPHLGTNIGVGGKVIGESVQCPFHGWRFDNEGKCTHIPGIDSTVNAKLTKYNTTEYNEHIFVWFHNNSEEPEWRLFDEYIMESGLTFKGRLVFTVDTHFQDIYENFADSQHFNTIHSRGGFTGNIITETILGKLFGDLLQFEWTNDFIGQNSNKQTALVFAQLTSKLFGKSLSALKITESGTQIGAAFLIYSSKLVLFDKTISEVIVITSSIQKSPLKSEFRFLFFAKKGFLNDLLFRLLFSEIKIHVERDAVVWNNKKYVKNPVYTKNESPLLEFRRWYKQFYE